MSVVLTVDIDFFVTPTAIYQSGDERLDDEEYKVWGESDARNFLEKNCCLSSHKKIPGKLVERHDQVFDSLLALSSDKRLMPVDLINVDAHSDLGLGDAGWVHILLELMHRPPTERATNLRKNRRIDGLNEANWVAYAIANRWVHELTLVKQVDEHYDLFPYYFQEKGIYEKIQMYPFSEHDYSNIGELDADGYRDFFLRKTTSEPVVKLHLLGADNFRLTSAPDYVFFCHSPGFTPPKADFLLQIAKEYFIGSES